MAKIKFGTDGWRAVIAEDFTFENLGNVAGAIALYLKNNNFADKGVFIGYDNRFLSEDFALHCAKVLASCGIKPFVSSVSVPTPLTAFMAINLKLGGSIMLTASHNPAKYNGIKFITHYGGPAGDNITSEIEANLQKILDKGSIKKIELSNESIPVQVEIVSDFDSYKIKLIESVDLDLIKKAAPEIALDTMNGAGSIIMPEILTGTLNLKPLILNNSRDALFGGKLPDPSEKNLKQLYGTIISKKLDLGLALDGDADRFGAIDGKGAYISPNNAIALILHYFIERKRHSGADIAVRTVATTHLIDSICISAGIKAMETPVGFKYIAQKMLEGNVLIGGEESGGLSIKGHIPEKDGLLANLLLLEIQSYLKIYRNSMYLSEYLGQIYEKHGRYYNVRLDIEVEPDKKNSIIDYFRNLSGGKISSKKVIKVITIDGAKVLLEDGSWVLVRASGTEPLIRCYIESIDKEYFKDLQSSARKIISGI
ncbi:MAG: phosphoglucomutase/phosphomannomutase family protein [Actinobacteria bacterium]|nr:phosphoglucomutase/phosphomannomutase family protein [Actinomycetota bacterium]